MQSGCVVHGDSYVIVTVIFREGTLGEYLLKTEEHKLTPIKCKNSPLL